MSNNIAMSASSAAPAISEAGVKDGNIEKEEDAPANAVSVAPKKKEPPPETPESIRLRAFVILSFWAIILFLGLPIWWRTTTIYRARLPLDQMMDWADGRVIILEFKGDSRLTFIGMPACLPTSNIHRGRFSARSRSSASFTNYPACTRRLERFLGASSAFTTFTTCQCLSSGGWLVYGRGR
jgi:hypothetical protein